MFITDRIAQNARRTTNFIFIGLVAILLLGAPSAQSVQSLPEFLQYHSASAGPYLHRLRFALNKLEGTAPDPKLWPFKTQVIPAKRPFPQDTYHIVMKTKDGRLLLSGDYRYPSNSDGNEALRTEYFF